MFSTMPKIGTLMLLNMDTPRRASMRAISYHTKQNKGQSPGPPSKSGPVQEQQKGHLVTKTN